MPSTVVGLDIGHGVLRAAEVADAAKARPTLVRYHHVAIPASAVDRGEVVDKATVAAGLRQLWAEGGFKSKNVVIGMGNQRVLVRDITVPRMPRERIKESLPFQVQDILPVPVADTLLDFYPIAEGADEGRPVVTGLLVAAIKEAVLANVEAVQARGPAARRSRPDSVRDRALAARPAPPPAAPSRSFTSGRSPPASSSPSTACRSSCASFRTAATTSRTRSPPSSAWRHARRTR